MSFRIPSPSRFLLQTVSTSIAFSVPKRTLLRGVLAGSALAFSAFGTTTTAHADSYHAAQAGETLSAIAARYGVSTQDIRTLNSITFSDTAALPAMLLVVPETSAGAASAIVAAPVASDGPAVGSGSLTRSIRYKVRTGDTLESIAAQYATGGADVTAQSIAQKNRLALDVTLKAGDTVLVPVGGAIYRANAQTKAKSKTVNAVQVSEEFDWPVAEVVPQSQPVYRAPAGNANNRGGSPRDMGNRNALSSRSMTNPNQRGNLDGARVLQPNEDAPNSAPPKSNARAVQAPTQATTTAQRIAKVSKVALNGARIRRLPDAQAATLYSCPVSTELAVIRTSGMWSAILMEDHSTGWVPTRYLQSTGASVDISSLELKDLETDVIRRSSKNKFAMTGKFSSNNPFVATALTWLGTPYVYGGESRRGIDCSAMVQASFRSNGVRLPRTAAEQSKVGQRVDPSDPSRLQPGDRLYFSASGTRVDHTGLYMGNGLFVHASGSGRGVIVSNLLDRRNWNILVGARR